MDKAAAFHLVYVCTLLWVETGVIMELWWERGIPLYLTEGANHSLETGDVRRDVAILRNTIRKNELYLRGINT